MSTHTLSHNSPFAAHQTGGPANYLLASLPESDYQRLAQSLKSRSIRPREILQKQDEPISDVYFLTEGACSLVKVLQEGQTAEIASIGREGIIGAWVFFGEGNALGDTIVHGSQVSVEALDLEAFREEMQRHGAFYNVVIRYSQALTTQLMQTTVCNGLHSAEQRCCRWLLTMQDRLESETFRMTHEFVAQMLGLRRPTITLVFGELLDRGAIDYRRGLITIRDRRALELTACECYQQMTRGFQRLLPDIHANH